MTMTDKDSNDSNNVNNKTMTRVDETATRQETRLDQVFKPRTRAEPQPTKTAETT